jgi:iron complex transport system substrate-binding protein
MDTCARRAAPATAARWRCAAAGAAAAALLAGCGVPEPATDAGAAGAGGGYPLTVTTAHGDVTVEAAPERVVALGAPSADEVVSLGVDPVGVALDPATLEESAPWLADRVADTAEAGLVRADGTPDIEAIATLEPDLIVAETYLLTEKRTFDRLNAIAPTVAPDSTSVNVDWDVRLRSTAAALDAADEAERLITDIETEFADSGAGVPDGTTYQWVRADPAGFTFGNGSVFDLYGMEPAANQDNTQSSDPLPRENTAELDADFLAVWAPEGRAELEEDPLFRSLPAVEDGTVYFADADFANAINSPAPIALRWLREELTPTLGALS